MSYLTRISEIALITKAEKIIMMYHRFITKLILAAPLKTTCSYLEALQLADGPKVCEDPFIAIK